MSETLAAPMLPPPLQLRDDDILYIVLIMVVDFVSFCVLCCWPLNGSPRQTLALLNMRHVHLFFTHCLRVLTWHLFLDNNEPMSIPSVAQLTAASVERRRPRLHTRLRRSRGQSGDDNMDSDVGAPETPLDELPPFSDEGDIDREGRHGLIDEEGAVIPHSHTVRRHPISKAAAYKLHIESLESVPIVDLPVAERMCPICYNEYGVEGPEGINEAPLRIPRCKHVFGDHCIKKWLCQKHSCPYCRESAFGMDESELPPGAEAARREAIEYETRPLSRAVVVDSILLTRNSNSARARQQWLQGVTALHRAVGDSRRANARPHPPPSDSEDQQRRTRQRLSREDTSLQSGLNGSGETALADGSQAESQSSHETQQQPMPRAPPMETLPPPTRLLTSREHGMGFASHLLRNMPRQPLPPSFVGPYPWAGHMQPVGFPPPFDPIHGPRSPEPVGPMFQYGPDGPVPVYAQPLASFDPPAHFSAPPGYPPNNMQPDATVVPPAGLNPAAIAPFSPSPDRPHHAEAPAPYRANVPAHPDPGNNGHSEQQSPGSASTRRRVW